VTETASEDTRYMRRALALAARGWGRVAPNPLVGAIVVRDGEVVGEGWHTEYGQPHAEVEALRAAGERARGATMYVTLEPCSHHGKTPPCTDAVRAAGITRLVYACGDPNPHAAGGAERLTHEGIEVAGGVEEARARDLNAPFFHAHHPAGADRPWLELKLALSLDARVADRERRSAWITGEQARAEVHRLRAGHDAIAVGIGTVLADDPQLTVRGDVQPRRAPVRVVFDRALRLPPDSRLARTAVDVPVWAVCDPGTPRARRAELERLGVRVMEAEGLGGALRALRAAEIHSIFCEGGAILASALLSADVVDRLTLFYAPLFLGPEGLSPFGAMLSPAIEQAARWRTVRSAAFGSDAFLSLAPR
jgi:diaminohydroxyphosphoribosylaminopyrimidine deaminase/5-amino-6-(5-phosphoribosylamino)uracil reductase